MLIIGNTKGIQDLSLDSFSFIIFKVQSNLRACHPVLFRHNFHHGFVNSIYTASILLFRAGEIRFHTYSARDSTVAVHPRGSRLFLEPNTVQSINIIIIIIINIIITIFTTVYLPPS